MSAGVSFLTDAYRNAVQKRTQLEPAEWCRENVSLFRSTDSSSYRPEFTPWWSEPMKEIRDNSNRVICITTPVGSGKSTMIEAVTCNIMDGDPGPMLITGQTNEDIRDWAETGLWPTLAACKPLKAKLPKQRGKWRKMELIIPPESDPLDRGERLRPPVKINPMGDCRRGLDVQEGKPRASA